MLPVERQSLIKEWITAQHHMKISELSLRLKVSEMTVHRDIQPLIDEGVIVKTFGGITLAANTTRAESDKADRCILCQQPINGRLNYRMIKSNGEMEIACCAHCGLLRHHQLGDEVIQGLCSDFLLHTTISVFSAAYVIDPNLQISCCNPQILTFGSAVHAESFVKGFGGRFMAFEAMKKEVARSMEPGASCH